MAVNIGLLKLQTAEHTQNTDVNGAVFLSASSEHSALYRQNRKSLQDA
jgi:hypothetical protein